jgi:hypothetical protein
VAHTNKHKLLEILEKFQGMSFHWKFFAQGAEGSPFARKRHTQPTGAINSTHSSSENNNNHNHNHQNELNVSKNREQNSSHRETRHSTPIGVPEIKIQLSDDDNKIPVKIPHPEGVVVSPSGGGLLNYVGHNNGNTNDKYHHHARSGSFSSKNRLGIDEINMWMGKIDKMVEKLKLIK